MGGAARLSDIVTTLAPIGVTNAEDALHRQELEMRSKHLVTQQNVLVEELSILKQYAKSLENSTVPVEEMFKFLEVFREKQMKTLEAILAYEKPIAEANRAVEKARMEMTVRKGKANSKVTVRIHAEKASTITLQLCYST